MKLYGTWRVTLPGEEYTFAPDDIMLSDEMLLESELGAVTFDQWLGGIDRRRATECQVLVWFLRRKAGQQQERAQVDFPIRRLKLERLDEPESDEDVDQGEAPAGSEPATEPTSPPSTESAPGNGSD